MIVESLTTLHKVHSGSQSKFAYIILAFTCLYGVVPTTQFVFYGVENYSLFSELQLVFRGLTLQSWIFGCRYLKSGLRAS